MGKFMRKAKITRDVAALMDSSHFSIGVRTRAKTLALKKLHFSASPTPNPNLCFLELRSRKLEKPKLVSNPRPSSKTSSNVLNSAESGSCLIRASLKEIESNLGLADRERRESTPVHESSRIRIISSPSLRRSKKRYTSRRNPNRNRNRNIIPTTVDLDDFFNIAEQEEQTLFMAKWNFDVVNDEPLEGRFEWIPMY